MVKKKSEKNPRITAHTTAWVLRTTLEQIRQVQEESEYILTQDMVVSKALECLLKKNPKKIKWG